MFFFHHRGHVPFFSLSIALLLPLFFFDLHLVKIVIIVVVTKVIGMVVNAFILLALFLFSKLFLMTQLQVPRHTQTNRQRD